MDHAMHADHLGKDLQQVLQIKEQLLSVLVIPSDHHLIDGDRPHMLFLQLDARVGQNAPLKCVAVNAKLKGFYRVHVQPNTDESLAWDS
jgi:hypothetical protein